MKLLIVGGNGMAGHMLVDYFRRCASYSVQFTTRDASQPGGLPLDVRDFEAVGRVMDAVKPDVVINCVGVLNEQAAARAGEAYRINGALPHYLAASAEETGGRLIHISTDCVFAGNRGDYAEHEPPDGTTVYARSKALGETNDARHLTIRTSFIGPEIRRQGSGLWQWFMRQEGTVRGYTDVIWNGITTLELARAIDVFIRRRVGGLVHLTAPEKISKYGLLCLLQDVFHKEIDIVRDGQIKLDRTLKHTREDVDYRVPDYKEMLLDMREWMRGA